MARKLDSTVQRAGFSAWLGRVFTPAKRETRDAERFVEPAAALPERGGIAAPRPAMTFEPARVPRRLRRYGTRTSSEGVGVRVYFVGVFLGTFAVAYAVRELAELGFLIGAVALFLNLIVFFVAVPAHWEKDIKVTACLLGVVFPSAYVVAAWLDLAPALF